MSQRLLIVEDDASMRNLVSYVLKEKGYETCEAATGAEALDAVRAALPDLILLDLILPDIDGYEVCRRLRQNPRTAGVLIVMLSQRNSDDEIAKGLSSYADDYVPKPFSTLILLAKIEAVLRRKGVVLSAKKGGRITIERLSVDPASREVHVGGSPVVLRRLEFEILHYLAARPNMACTRATILDAVRDDGREVSERTIDNHIFWLRRKLGAAGDLIETIPGYGYKLKSA